MSKSPSSIIFEPPMFALHTEIHGGKLSSITREHHALWWYYVIAMRNYRDDEKGERVVYEGEPDLNPQYEQLFRRAAELYGVDVNTLANFWPVVDAEIDRWNSWAHVLTKRYRESVRLTKLPTKLRFLNTSIAIDTKKVN